MSLLSLRWIDDFYPCFGTTMEYCDTRLPSVFSFLTCKCFGLDNPVESYAAAELDDDVKMAMLVDETNAYSFLYPVQVPGKKSSFRWYCNFVVFSSSRVIYFVVLLSSSQSSGHNLLSYYVFQGRVQEIGAIFFCSATIS
jgi:hypothetical protein